MLRIWSEGRPVPILNSISCRKIQPVEDTGVRQSTEMKS